MTLLGMDVLLVGQSFQTAAALSSQLRRWGFRCRFAGNILAACRLLRSVPVDVVLSDMHLSDGSGFRLLALLTGLPVSAFLCLPVENSCFWLPAIDAGRECLGSPALRPSEFANALEEMSRCLEAAPAPNTDAA
jgi:response regulator RpfG family c-di-GMP phosphodiesterase